MPDNITGKNTGELTRITAAEVDAATHLLPWWNPDAIGADRTQAIVVNELVTLIRNLLGPTGQEVVLASANPAAAPTDNESVYIRRDTGDYWVAKADKSGWDGPFLAFTAGERSKLITIQSSATANSSDATLLDRANHTGTQAIATVSGLQSALDEKQPLDSDLTAIAASGTGSAGLQVLQQATAAGVRAAIGVGTLSTQNADAVAITGGSASNLLIKDTVIDTALFQGATGVSVGRSAFYDRFAGANLRHNVTVTTISGSPASDPLNVFDASTDSFATFSAGSVVQYEIDFGIEAFWAPNINSGFVYAQGAFYVDQYHNETPQNVLIELFVKHTFATDQWVTVGNLSTYAPYTNYTSIRTPTNWIYCKKARVTITAKTGAVSRIANLRYIPDRPNSTETPTAIFSVGAATQKLFGAIECRNLDNSIRTTIGQGTIRVGANAGAINGTEAVTTTLSSPGIGWSFNWAKAQVGDEIRIVPTNGSAVAITGRCATAGTVLADTSAWTAGLQIQLKIIRMSA